MRPYNRYSSRCTTTDAVTFDTTDVPTVRYSSVRSYFSLHVASVDAIADHSVTLNAPELRLDVRSYYLCTVYLF